MRGPKCGWCGSTDTDAEFVNNGVGMEQVTAATCSNCGAVQMGPEVWVSEADLDPEDKKRGWYASEETEGVVAAVRDVQLLHAFDYNQGETLLVQHNGTVHQAFKRVSWGRPTFQFLCGHEVEVTVRPHVDAITCFDCIAYWAKGRL